MTDRAIQNNASDIGNIPSQCDLVVIGGGINGTGIARDAAGRGLSVILCEQDDLASHTSSASTKLIHGGLRYLEHYEFSLVRKALAEREVLMRAAPHLIRPLRFVLPHDSHQRPAWLIRAGLFLYDHLAKRELLPASSRISLQKHPAGNPLKPRFTDGFCYSDAWVDDARLVVANALDAAQRGASILTRTRFEKADKHNGAWQVSMRRADGTAIAVQARCLINAAGPWTSQLLQNTLHGTPRHPLRLVKGSHIIVNKLFDHPYAYLFQHTDRRIVFAIPYEGNFTLIGTTDVEFDGDPSRVEIDAQEIQYLCELGSYYFRQPVTSADIRGSYSGVRPLLDNASGDASAVTRDYYLELDASDAPVLSIFGGKITTYRKLAEEVLDKLTPILHPPHGAWTASAYLPGANFGKSRCLNNKDADFADFMAAVQQQFNWLPSSLVKRYACSYGVGMEQLLHGCARLADLGQEIIPGLFEVEARHWMKNEWASTADDMLWRRSKLGLHAATDASSILENWIRKQKAAVKGAARYG